MPYRKITAGRLRLWREVVDFSQPLTGDAGDRGDAGSDGEIYTYRVNGMLPVIVWDTEFGKRRIVPMRPGKNVAHANRAYGSLAMAPFLKQHSGER